MKRLFFFLLISIIFGSCIHRYRSVQDEYFILTYYQSAPYHSNYIQLHFANTPMQLGVWYDPNDSKNEYIFIGDTIDKLDKLKIKPNIILTVKYRNENFKCYRYSDKPESTEYIDVLIRDKEVKFIRAYFYLYY